jgi:hypothetical protein
MRLRSKRRPPRTSAERYFGDHRPTKEAPMQFETQITKEILGKLKRKAHQEVDSFARRHFRIKEVCERKEAEDRVHTFNTIRAALSR